MGYEPLHHKYRPQTFAELVGQAAIATTLSNAMHQQRIAPAYLFTGARGTGKTSTARIMSKSLNCLQSDHPTPFPCGLCEMCRSITKGIALDVTEIDAASNTGVDNIREIIERAQFAPVQARYKVYVIDECHMLSNAAFNALLKTLEEPPDRVVFMLATTDPQRVLPTIISRCQRFDFRRIPLEAMVEHLRQIAELEHIAITPQAVTVIAQLSQGGLRDAESLLDQLSLLEGIITPEMVWDLVGSVPEKDLLLLLTAIVQGNSIGIIEQTRHILDRGREPLIVLQSLASLYRDLLIAQNAPQRFDLVAWTEEGWQKLAALAQQFSMAQLLVGQQHLRQAEVQLKNTTQPRLWLEVTLMGLLDMPSPVPPSAPPPQRVTPAAVVEAPPPIGGSGVSAGEVTGAPVAPPIVLEPEVSPRITLSDRDTEAIWQDILIQLSPASKAMFAQQGKCLAITSQQIKIGLPNATMHKIAEQKKAEITLASERSLKRKIQVTFEVLSAKNKSSKALPSPSVSSPTPGASPPQSPQTQEIRPPIVASPPFSKHQEDEAIKNILHLFGGEVVDSN